MQVIRDEKLDKENIDSIIELPVQNLYNFMIKKHIVKDELNAMKLI